MSRNNNRSNSRNQIINIPEHENIFSNKGISFNYSENLNHVTEERMEDVFSVENMVTTKRNVSNIKEINFLNEIIKINPLNSKKI